MAIYLTEYNVLQQVPVDHRGGPAQLPMEPALAEQTVAVGVEAQSSAFQEGTRVLRLMPEEDCHVKFGLDPEATTSTQKLLAGFEYWRGVQPGHKVSVIAAA